MTRYFVAANFWLVFAVVTILGRTFERSSPTMVSFFHIGQWFYPGTYTLIVTAMFVVSAVFFILTCKTRKNRDA
jgi:hypothetical protein